MNESVRKAGYTPYNVSRSNHDIEGGSRYFYTVKDVITPFRDDVVTENSAFIFCDVDYYCDMNRWLSIGQPCVLYTLVPQTLSHRAVDYAYHIKDDQVHYQVSGGAVYSHPLWKYEGDTPLSGHPRRGSTGIPSRTKDRAWRSQSSIHLVRARGPYHRPPLGAPLPRQ